MISTAKSGRSAEPALRVAVYWRERLLDVRPLRPDESALSAGARFEDGGLTYVVSRAGPVEAVPRGWPTRDDAPFLLWVSGVFLAFAFSATLAVRLAPDEDAEPTIARAATTMSRTVFRRPPMVKELQARAQTKDEPEQVRSQRRRSSHRPLEAKDAGLLGALRSHQGSPLFERVGLHERISSALDRLSGAPSAEVATASGINPRHGGSGGPGTDFGLGGIGPISRQARGDGLIALTGLRKRPVTPEPPPTVVGGEGLPRDVVAKVIARNARQILACYEQVLQHVPELGGKVTVMFTIGPSGAVEQADIAESTAGNNELDACLVSKVRRWKFPEPKGGGVVSVTHPWVFRRVGAEE